MRNNKQTILLYLPTWWYAMAEASEEVHIQASFYTEIER